MAVRTTSLPPECAVHTHTPLPSSRSAPSCSPLSHSEPHTFRNPRNRGKSKVYLMLTMLTNVSEQDSNDVSYQTSAQMIWTACSSSALSSRKAGLCFVLLGPLTCHRPGPCWASQQLSEQNYSHEGVMKNHTSPSHVD